MNDEETPDDETLRALAVDALLQEHNDAMRQWQFAVSILPAEKMDTPYGLWTACCAHPDHTATWTSAPHTAGTAAVALTQHWKAKHVKSGHVEKGEHGE